MMLEPLAIWDKDALARGVFVPVEPTGDATAEWLNGVSGHLSIDLWRRGWPAKGVAALQGSGNVSAALGCSDRTLRRLIKAGLITVDHGEYWIRTTIAEVWNCRDWSRGALRDRDQLVDYEIGVAASGRI